MEKSLPKKLNRRNPRQNFRGWPNKRESLSPILRRRKSTNDFIPRIRNSQTRNSITSAEAAVPVPRSLAQNTKRSIPDRSAADSFGAMARSAGQTTYENCHWVDSAEDVSSDQPYSLPIAG